MTLEQTTQCLLDAAESQDLATLQAALQLRAAAMRSMASLPPTEALRDAVARSLAAGEEAQRAIRALRQRMRQDSRTLANIEHGFLRAASPSIKHRIDYQG